MSRVHNILTWVARLRKVAPLTAISQEVVRFDTQLMENPDMRSIEYQHGTLYGYEVREYLLEKWGRRCVYCGAKETPLEVEHIQARSKGGSSRISNLVRRFTHHSIPVTDGKGQEGDLWVSSLTS